MSWKIRILKSLTHTQEQQVDTGHFSVIKCKNIYWWNCMLGTTENEMFCYKDKRWKDSAPGETETEKNKKANKTWANKKQRVLFFLNLVFSLISPQATQCCYSCVHTLPQEIFGIAVYISVHYFWLSRMWLHQIGFHKTSATRTHRHSIGVWHSAGCLFNSPLTCSAVK